MHCHKEQIQSQFSKYRFQWEHCFLLICAPRKSNNLDLSADSDNEPDANEAYTSVTLEAGPLPESFTICSALMVEAWTSEFSSADNEYRLAGIHLVGITQYRGKLGRISLIKQTECSSPSNGQVPASPLTRWQARWRWLWTGSCWRRRSIRGRRRSAGMPISVWCLELIYRKNS